MRGCTPPTPPASRRRGTCRRGGSRQRACGRCRTRRRLWERVGGRVGVLGSAKRRALEHRRLPVCRALPALSPSPAFHVQVATACHFLILTSNVIAGARWTQCAALPPCRRRRPGCLRPAAAASPGPAPPRAPVACALPWSVWVQGGMRADPSLPARLWGAGGWAGRCSQAARKWGIKIERGRRPVPHILASRMTATSTLRGVVLRPPAPTALRSSLIAGLHLPNYASRLPKGRPAEPLARLHPRACLPRFAAAPWLLIGARRSVPAPTSRSPRSSSAAQVRGACSARYEAPIVAQSTLQR
jgi:hypothetical protein